MERYFDRSLDSLGAVFGFLDEFYVSHPVADSVSFAINLAIEELFTNIIKYAKGGDDRVRITLGPDDQGVRATITDYDVDSFDVTQDTDFDPNAPIDARSPGGVGLYLVRTMMDELEYSYVDRTAMITLVKHTEEPPNV